jgi:hypothetical protein
LGDDGGAAVFDHHHLQAVGEFEGLWLENLRARA